METMTITKQGFGAAAAGCAPCAAKAAQFDGLGGKHRKRHHRGMGSAIVARPMGRITPFAAPRPYRATSDMQLGAVVDSGSMGGALAGPVAGLVGTGGTTLLLRMFLSPKDNPGLYKWAPALGLLGGALGTGVAYALGGGPAALAAAVSAIAHAGVQVAAERQIFKGSAPDASAEDRLAYTERLAALIDAPPADDAAATPATGTNGLGLIIARPAASRSNAAIGNAARAGRTMGAPTVLSGAGGVAAMGGPGAFSTRRG